MPNWLKKSLVILITVFTLGTVSPPQYLLAQDTDETVRKISSNYVPQQSSERNRQDTRLDDPNLEKEPQSSEKPQFQSWQEIAATIEDSEVLTEKFINYTTEQAHVQTTEKFGPKIEQKIGNEFETIILPKIEEVLSVISDRYDVETLKNLAITDQPAAGLGEMIFNIYNLETGKDIVRFHVRRDKPPQAGYWFSFHCHLADDHYMKHYNLGKIFWDKNTPPKRMAH